MFYEMTFTLMGIASLIGWNAVLSSFSFFAEAYGDRVFTKFTTPIQVANCIGGLTLPLYADKVGLKVRIVGALLVLSVLLIFFPILAMISPDDTGFYISLGLTFLIGIVNSVAQNSMISLAGQEGGKLNMLFWVATGYSGLSMAVSDLVLNSFLSGVENGELISTIIFFILASVLSFMAIAFTLKYLKKRQLEREQSEYNEQADEMNTVDEGENAIDQKVSQFSDNNDDNDISLKEKLVGPISEEAFDVLPIWKKVQIALAHEKFIPLFIWLIYICTFTVFPGLFLNGVHFQSEFLSGIWGVKFLNFTYQIGDVAGKYIGGVEALQKTIPQYILVLLRFGFIATGLAVFNQSGSFFSNDWFPFVQMIVMATTNGIATAALMNLGPKKGNGNMKIIGIIGFINALALTSGIAIGSEFGDLISS